MDIKDIVNAQVQVLTELNELLDYEKEVLIKDTASELSEIVNKKKLIAQKISLLERKRQELSGTKTAEQLITEGVLGKNQVAKLKELTFLAKEKGDTNLILTRQSIYYIRMITSALNPNQRVVTYGNTGQIGDSAANIFTTKV